MTRPASLRRPAATALLAMQVLASGCHSWQTQSGSAESVLFARPELAKADTTVVTGPDGKREVTVKVPSVRVSTLAEPRMTEVMAPRVVQDTLFGTNTRNGDATAIPLSQVTAVQVRKGNAAKTTGLIVGVTVGSFILVGLAVAATCEPSGIGSVC